MNASDTAGRGKWRVDARMLYAAVALASLGLIGAALFMQHVVGLNPCPLCIFQRIAFLLMAIAAALAAWRAPHRAGRAALPFAVAALLFGLIGAGVAAWHVRLLQAPAALACGPGLHIMLENFPLTQVLPRVFAGSGDCTDGSAVLFGVSLAAWALLGYGVLMLTTIAALSRSANSGSR